MSSHLPRTHYFLSDTRIFAYVYIRKNACSVFKKMMLDSLPAEDQDKEIPDVQKMRALQVPDATALAECHNRIFVVRDPLERIVSGFINQIATKIDMDYPRMFDNIISATEEPLEELTFEKFVKLYLSRKTRSYVNGHFHLMISHLTSTTYTHVLYDQALLEDARAVFGDAVAEKYFSRKMNSTGSARIYEIEDATKVTAGEISEMYATKEKLPSKASFLTKHMREALSEIYAGDIKLFNDYIAKRKESGDRPVALDLRNLEMYDSFQ